MFYCYWCHINNISALNTWCSFSACILSLSPSDPDIQAEFADFPLDYRRLCQHEYPLDDRALI